MRQLLMCVLMMMFVACGGSPKTAAEQQDKFREANATLQSMLTRDPSLRPLLDQSAGYVVFPSIGKGGLVVGAAHGRGVLYEHGRPTGFVTLDQGSLGAQIGAQTFSELVVFRYAYDIAKLRGGSYSIGGNVSAVALTAGRG